MVFKTLVVGPFQCNCRLLACPKTGEALLIDPGAEAPELIQMIEREKLSDGRPLKVKYLLHTHAHLDHIGATSEVTEGLQSKASRPKILLHREDEALYQQLQMQGRMFGLNYAQPLSVDQFIEHEERIQIGDIKIDVIHTPGHSPGSVCFRLHEDSSIGSKETLFSGDTLFYQSVGRTDLWGANQDQMFKSIRERIYSLDGDTRVCPGHGPDTTVQVEKRENPFVRG